MSRLDDRKYYQNYGGSFGFFLKYLLDPNNHLSGKEWATETFWGANHFKTQPHAEAILMRMLPHDPVAAFAYFSQYASEPYAPNILGAAAKLAPEEAREYLHRLQRDFRFGTNDHGIDAQKLKTRYNQCHRRIIEALASVSPDYLLKPEFFTLEEDKTIVRQTLMSIAERKAETLLPYCDAIREQPYGEELLELMMKHLPESKVKEIRGENEEIRSAKANPQKALNHLDELVMQPFARVPLLYLAKHFPKEVLEKSACFAAKDYSDEIIDTALEHFKKMPPADNDLRMTHHDKESFEKTHAMLRENDDSAEDIPENVIDAKNSVKEDCITSKRNLIFIGSRPIEQPGSGNAIE